MSTYEIRELPAPSGSAAAPSIAFLGDPNTGIYSPGADQVAISTNGTGRLQIDSNGIVRTGSAVGAYGGASVLYPTANGVLDVASNVANVPGVIKLGNAGFSNTAEYATGAVEFRGFDSVGNTMGYASVEGLVSDATAATRKGTIVFKTINAGTVSEKMRLTAEGRLGLGSSTPDALLTVNGISSFGAGAVGTPSIARSGDLDTGFWFPAANTLAASTAGTERIRVDGSGNVNVDNGTFYVDAVNNRVSIGTTSPLSPLTVQADWVTGEGQFQINAPSGQRFSGLSLQNNGATFGYLYHDNTDSTIDLHAATSQSIRFITNASEKARIDTSGRLLVGTSTAFNFVNTNTTTVTPRLQLAGLGEDPSSFGLFHFTAGGVSRTSSIAFARSQDGTFGNQGIVLVNSKLGELSFHGSDGVKFVHAANIRGEVDGTTGVDDMPGRIVMSVTLDGASSPTEAFRITNDRVRCYNQPAPTTESGAATLTVAELKTGIIEYTGSANTLTLPTGTLMEGGFSGIYTNMTFEWSVINTGSGTCTIGTDTGHTIVGAATVANGASGRFASRRTGSNTFVTYRLA